jgi:hypothetical protein
LATAIALSLTGCGSTLKRSSSGLPSDTDTTVQGLDSAGSTGGTSGTAGGGSTGFGTTGGGSTGSGATGFSTTGGGSTGSGATGFGTTGGGSTGLGTTGGGTTGGNGAVTKPINLGLIVVDTTAIAAAFGAEGGSSQKPTNDFVNYLNKTGGFAGRQIKPVYYTVDGSKDGNTASQEACEKFKDSKVELVLATGSGDVLSSCLGNAGIVVIDYNSVAFDDVDVARFRNRFLPSAMRIDRLFKANIEISVQRGLLKKGDTLGVLREDCIWGQRTMQKTIRPLAKQLGLKLVEGTHVCLTSADSIATAASDIQREVVRFQSQGVTHVMGLSTAEAFILSRFTNTASQQKYYPKYLVTSTAYPYTNSRDGATINIAKDALPNIYGVGYLQMFDVGDNDTPPAAQVKQREECRKADPSQLGATSQTNNQKYFLRQAFWGECDGFFVARAMLEVTHGNTSLAALQQAYLTALGHGKKVSAALTGGYHEVTSSRLDGAGYLRPFAWNAAKKSFLYTAPKIAIP